MIAAWSSLLCALYILHMGPVSEGAKSALEKCMALTAVTAFSTFSSKLKWHLISKAKTGLSSNLEAQHCSRRRCVCTDDTMAL